MSSVGDWLRELGLEKYTKLFAEHEITLEVLPHLTEADIGALGLPTGSRRRLTVAIQALASAPVPTTATPRSSEPWRAATAERRQLTVMFCDLVGSTTLAQKLDPELMRELMRAYQNTCAQVIQRYEGHVAQYLGDGLMVYFGWPQAHENDAERSIRASLAIIEAVKLMPATEPIRVRIGVATGPVVVGETGAGDASVPKMAVGETPNLAARLQGIAGPDEIVIGQNTHRLLGSAFELHELGARSLKGIVEPVHAWRVVGTGKAEGRFEAVQAGAALTPLVGREEEIHLLMRRWQAARDGEGQIVLLCGEPGVGKSRITRVLRDHLAEESHVRLRYQCSPFHTNSAFFPVIEQFERAAGFAREDTPDTKLNKMERVLGDAIGDISTVAPLFAAMLSLPVDRYRTVRLSPQQHKDKLIEALVSQVLGLARTQPVLYLLEDAHWADPSTLEALDRMLDRIESMPVLVVITHRVEFVPAWVGRPRVTSLTLPRLSRRDAATLAERVTAGKKLPPEVLDKIVEKTDGVPLFVEELTKAVIESGLLIEQRDHYALSGPLPPLAIPSSLQDSLMARLDRLAPLKEIAQLGAVIGREFSHELLVSVASLPPEQLDLMLVQLVASELVVRYGSPPHATYVFKHALVQDAAYQSILRSRREELHGLIARALEERFHDITEGAPELLATHYEKAGMPDNAIVWLLQAGHRAQTRSANKEAVNHLEQALSLLDHISNAVERSSLELDIGASLGTLHMTLEGFFSAKARTHFERVHELRDTPGHDQEKFIARAGLIICLCYIGRSSEARALCEDLVHVASATKQRVPELIARERYANTLMYSGRYQDSLDQWARVLELYDPEADIGLAFQYGYDPGVSALALSAYMHWQLGYPEKARRSADASVALARGVGHGFTLAFALTYGGADFSYFMRDPARALPFAREGEEVTRKGGFIYLHTMCSFHHAWSYTKQGSSPEALDRMRRALDHIRQLGIVAVILPRLTAQVADAYAEAGDPDEGLEVLESSPDRAPGRKRIRFSDIYWIEGDLHLTKSNPDPALAESCYLEAIAIAVEDRAKIPQLRASVRLAKLWLSQGKGGGARELLQPLYDSFTEGFGIPDLMEAKQILELAQAMSSQDSPPVLETGSNPK